MNHAVIVSTLAIIIASANLGGDVLRHFYQVEFWSSLLYGAGIGIVLSIILNACLKKFI